EQTQPDFHLAGYNKKDKDEKLKLEAAVKIPLRKGNWRWDILGLAQTTTRIEIPAVTKFRP
ncbi:MAG: hypothetical protein DMG06_05920, partial [Acidobacteria bacterium]